MFHVKHFESEVIKNMESLGTIIASIFSTIGDVLNPSIAGVPGESQTTSVTYAAILAVPTALGILSLAKYALKKSGGKK